MKTLLLFLSTIFLCQNVMGQISGKFTTTNDDPVPFANVLLISTSDSVLIKGEITDVAGAFELNHEKPGTYFVRFTGVGYQTWDSESFQLSDSNPQKHLGTQVVIEDAQQLSELVVRGQKPFLQQEIDRTVINVESSVLSKGSSALQVLERSPGVYVDKRNNNIALDGKSSVMMMLNGKLMRLPMAQLIALLNSLSADDIEKIELITSPPAKYDADGSAGLINIVLKKREEIGTTGSVSATAGYGWKEKSAGSLSLSHNNGKMNMYGSYSVLHDNGRDGWDATGGQNMPAFGGELKVDAGSHTKANSNGQNATVGYDLNFKKLTTGGSINFSSNKTNRDISNYGSYTLLRSDSVLLMRAKIYGKSHWTNVLTSVYLEQQLRQGETLNFDLDYLSYKSENPTEGYTSYFDKSGKEALPNSDFFSNSQKGISSSPINVGVAKVDYVRQLSKKLKVEAGLKGTVTRSSSLSTIENLINGEWVGSSRYTNNTDMKENIGAAYSSFNIAVNPKVNLVAGLRYEYSHTYSDAAAEKNRINRKLSRFFPSFFLSKKINDQSELQFSYTKKNWPAKLQ